MRKHFLLLFFLCMTIACGALADTGTEICIERILHSKKDAVAIANRGGYITEVCKDYILHWADKQQEFESI